MGQSQEERQEQSQEGEQCWVRNTNVCAAEGKKKSEFTMAEQGVEHLTEDRWLNGPDLLSMPLDRVLKRAMAKNTSIKVPQVQLKERNILGEVKSTRKGRDEKVQQEMRLDGEPTVDHWGSKAGWESLGKYTGLIVSGTLLLL